MVGKFAIVVGVTSISSTHPLLMLFIPLIQSIQVDFLPVLRRHASFTIALTTTSSYVTFRPTRRTQCRTATKKCENFYITPIRRPSTSSESSQSEPTTKLHAFQKFTCCLQKEFYRCRQLYLPLPCVVCRISCRSIVSNKRIRLN